MLGKLLSYIASQFIETPKNVGNRGEGIVIRNLSKLDQTLYNVYNDINIPNTCLQGCRILVFFAEGFFRFAILGPSNFVTNLLSLYFIYMNSHLHSVWCINIPELTISGDQSGD